MKYSMQKIRRRAVMRRMIDWQLSARIFLVSR